MRHLPILNCSLLLALWAVGACSSGDGVGSAAGDGRPRVVASTAVIGEFVSIVAGDDADVRTLIPPGVDLHSFEPAPATAAAVAEADLIFVNGYNLEEGLLDIILENASGDAAVVPVAAGLESLSGERGEPARDGAERASADVIRAQGDPHFWLDVSNAVHYVEQIRDHLVALDPGRAAGYRARAAAYVEQLEALDQELRDEIAAIPEGVRELVVFHDAYQYFAAAYGLELIASVLPLGAQQEPGAAAVGKLIELIEEREITAIYREPQFGASVLESIADETGVAVLVIRSTYSDGIDSYVELMRANLAVLLEGSALRVTLAPA